MATRGPHDEDEELRGYTSPGEYDERYGDDGFDKDLSTVVIVDGLPKAPVDKFDKLMAFVVKIFSSAGTIVSDGIHMPLSPAGVTEGFAFIEYADKAAADKAMTSFHAYAMDKAHTLSMTRYVDFISYMKQPDVFVPPAVPQPKTRGDLSFYLMDEAGRDEFVVRSAGTSAGDHRTEIYWADARSPPMLDYAGQRQRDAGRYWTELQAIWSKRGTFLATFHPRGILCWGGPSYEEIFRFVHDNPTGVTFSPDERFAVTWNGRYRNPHPEKAAFVWDVRTGEKLRELKQVDPSRETCDLTWSADSKYLARIVYDTTVQEELVTIYEMPGCVLHLGRSHRAPGARDLSWCPKGGNLLAWWCPEKDNSPAAVQLMRPNREVVRQRNLVNVDSVEMVWHPDGTFLAVSAAKVQRKKKKATTGGAAVAVPAGSKAAAAAPVVHEKRVVGYMLDLYRLREKGVPMETLEFKDRIVQLRWEPHGRRFAVVTGDGPHYTVTVYNMSEKAATPVVTLEEKDVNNLFWSPRGEFIVLAGLQQLGGRLEFYDVERKKSLATVEHMQANEVAWDPSGRVVASSKSQSMTGEVTTRDKVENGFKLWTFQGVQIFDSPRSAMYSFEWRPRPELLTEEESRDVAKNLRKYIDKYADEDRKVEERRAKLVTMRRLRELVDFREHLTAMESAWLADRPRRIAAGLEEASTVTITEETYELVDSVTVEIV